MGQRTAIIVKKIDRYGKESLRIVHHQWGFGKTMPCMFMQEFLKYEYNNDKNRYSSKLKDFFNFTNSKYNLYSTKGLTKKDIFSKEFLKDVYGRLDNNNGAMLVEITEEPIEKDYDRGYVRIKDIKIGFVLGYEECIKYYNVNGEDKRLEIEKPFKRLVTAREYMEKTGGEHYCPNEFITMFEQFCNFWGIEQIADYVANNDVEVFKA